MGNQRREETQTGCHHNRQHQTPDQHPLNGPTVEIHRVGPVQLTVLYSPCGAMRTVMVGLAMLLLVGTATFHPAAPDLAAVTAVTPGMFDVMRSLGRYPLLPMPSTRTHCSETDPRICIGMPHRTQVYSPNLGVSDLFFTTSLFNKENTRINILTYTNKRNFLQ